MSRTNERLAHSLRVIGLTDLAARAEAGEFSDFASPHALPKHVLVTELQNTMQPAALKLAEFVKQGHYDDTKEDSDRWMQGAEGREALRALGINPDGGRLEDDPRG